MAKTDPPNNIRALRKERKMSQAALARLVDTYPQNIQRLESGQTKLNEEWMRKLAPHLGVLPADLMAGALPPARLDGRPAGYSAAFAQRLRRVVDRHRSLEAAAAAANCTPARLENMINGVEPAPFTTIAKLARAANVSLDWLATGEGADFAPQPLFQDHKGRYRIGRQQVDILDERTLLSALTDTEYVESRDGPFSAAERHDTILDVYYFLLKDKVKTLDFEDHLDEVVAFVRDRARRTQGQDGEQQKGNRGQKKDVTRP